MVVVIVMVKLLYYSPIVDLIYEKYNRQLGNLIGQAPIAMHYLYGLYGL